MEDSSRKEKKNWKKLTKTRENIKFLPPPIRKQDVTK